MYRCADNGCPCGWEWPYNPGEPKGRRHPSPLIQLTANSEERILPQKPVRVFSRPVFIFSCSFSLFFLPNPKNPIVSSYLFL